MGNLWEYLKTQKKGTEMNVFENQSLLRAILIAASGVVVGLMLSLGRGLARLG